MKVLSSYKCLAAKIELLEKLTRRLNTNPKMYIFPVPMNKGNGFLYAENQQVQRIRKTKSKKIILVHMHSRSNSHFANSSSKGRPRSWHWVARFGRFVCPPLNNFQQQHPCTGLSSAGISPLPWSHSLWLPGIPDE